MYFRILYFYKHYTEICKNSINGSNSQLLINGSNICLQIVVLTVSYNNIYFTNICKYRNMYCI